MKCVFCRRGGSAASLKKIRGGPWRCVDAGGCTAYTRAQRKTHNKRALWKKRSNPK